MVKFLFVGIPYLCRWRDVLAKLDRGCDMYLWSFLLLERQPRGKIGDVLQRQSAAVLEEVPVREGRACSEVTQTSAPPVLDILV